VENSNTYPPLFAPVSLPLILFGDLLLESVLPN